MVFTIIVAAGRGKRVGGKIPKQFLDLGGVPVWERALQPFLSVQNMKGIILVVPEDYVSHLRKYIRVFSPESRVEVVAGGRERKDSVWNGLQAVKQFIQPLNKNKDKGYGVTKSDPIILIHDGARPLVTRDLIEKVIEFTSKYGAVVPGLVLEDTVKMVKKNSEWVEKTLDRRRLRKIQTPQGFKFSVIYRAYQLYHRRSSAATDDAELVERLGCRVKIVGGEPANIKITTAYDLQIARALMKES